VSLIYFNTQQIAVICKRNSPFIVARAYVYPASVYLSVPHSGNLAPLVTARFMQRCGKQDNRRSKKKVSLFSPVLHMTTAHTLRTIESCHFGLSYYAKHAQKSYYPPFLPTSQPFRKSPRQIRLTLDINLNINLRQQYRLYGLVVLSRFVMPQLNILDGNSSPLFASHFY
jgi:hypothetical protein